MTIYFKNGETLHIGGEEGDLIKKQIKSCIMAGIEGTVVIDGKKEEVILNLGEVMAIR